MIPDPSKFDFILELIMSEDFPTHCVYPWIHDFSMFCPIRAFFDCRNPGREAFDELLCVFASDRGENVYGRQ
jgi:hypothetical protein